MTAAWEMTAETMGGAALDRVFPLDQCEDEPQGPPHGDTTGRRGMAGQRFVRGWLGVSDAEASDLSPDWHARFARPCGWLISEYVTGGPGADDEVTS